VNDVRIVTVDVKNSVSSCHVDGTIKRAVINNPGAFINYDEGLVPMLKRYREAGKKVIGNVVI
jgi:5'-nucleotidase